MAPTRIRADEIINVNVIILQLDYPQLFVRASIMRYDEEMAFASEVFKSASRRMLQMQVKRSSQARGRCAALHATGW